MYIPSNLTNESLWICFLCFTYRQLYLYHWMENANDLPCLIIFRPCKKTTKAFICSIWLMLCAANLLQSALRLSRPFAKNKKVVSLHVSFPQQVCEYLWTVWWKVAEIYKSEWKYKILWSFNSEYVSPRFTDFTRTRTLVWILLYYKNLAFRS